jgi:hypothetical protein
LHRTLLTESRVITVLGTVRRAREYELDESLKRIPTTSLLRSDTLGQQRSV